MRWGTAWTRRSGMRRLPAAGPGNVEPGPLRHAVSIPPPRYSRTGDTFRAICGAQVYFVEELSAFDASAKRACPKCRVVAVQAERQGERTW